MEGQVPGWEFGDAAESRRRRGAAGFWEEPSGSLGPHARRALGWPLRGIHLRCKDGTRALGRENLPGGPHVDGGASFVSGAAPPLPAGS